MPAVQHTLLGALTSSGPGPRRSRVRIGGGNGPGLFGLTVAMLLTASALEAQSNYWRFDITTVNDTTFTFATGAVRWVKPSQVGLVVDPAHGDELIAKFRVVRTGHITATAVVTGQTARLAATDIALITEPRRPFYVRPIFWIGLVVGGAVGFVIHR